MKNKRLLFLFITLLTLAQGAWADDPEWLKSGDSWDEETKTLTVNSNPVQNAYRTNTTIEHVIVSDNVESIGSLAFDCCTNLKTVFIGNGVESIGTNIFQNCTNLKGVFIGSSLMGLTPCFFSGCTSLKTVVITYSSSTFNLISSDAFPNNDDLKIYVPKVNGNIHHNYTIDNWASFYNSGKIVGYDWTSGTCAVGLNDGVLTVAGFDAMADYAAPGYRPWNNSRGDITSVVIEDGVPHIGDNAFSNCGNIASITIPASVTSIGAGIFSGCDNLTTITVDASNQTFDARNNCVAIIRKEGNVLVAGCNNTTIPATVQSIGEGAFSGCGSLTSITIPASVTSIGEVAFSGCGSLTSITIPNSVQRIGDNAFYNCTKLESVSIGSGVTSISPNVFNRCHNLRTITIDANNPTFDSRDGCNAIIRKSNDELVAGCRTTVIPNSVKSIGDMAFCQVGSLEAITIPNSVQSIGNTAFFECDILTYVTIGSGVTSIGDRAFFSCDYLEKVTIYATSVPTLGESVFDGSKSGCKFYVFSDRVEAYKAAWGWKYANYIEAIGGTCGKTNSDNVTWELAGELGNCTLIISGTGAMADYSAGYQPWAAYQSGITKVIIGSGVTEVSSNAFIGCENLTTVTIADGLYLHNGTEILSGDITDMTKVNGKTLKVAIPYIDADGNTAYCTDFTVIDGSVNEFNAPGWYVVNSNVIMGQLNFDLGGIPGAVNLLICDGATLNVVYDDFYDAFYDDISFNASSPQSEFSTLAIYGQTEGSGTINADKIIVNYNSFDSNYNLDINGGTINAKMNLNTRDINYHDYGITIRRGTVTSSGIYTENGNITISGGTVTVNSTDDHAIGTNGNITISGGTVTAETSSDCYYGISASKNITISGGRVTATTPVSDNCYGMWAGSGITLGWTNATDFITASSYYVNNYLTIADNKMMSNGTEVLSGTIYDVYNQIDNLSKLNGKTLQVALQITLPAGVTATGTGVFTQADGAYAVPGATVILAAPAGYNLSDVSSSEVTITETEGVYSFTMPASDVTVTATLTAIPWDGTGTEDDPWVIEYPSQLNLLAQRVNDGTGDDYAASGYNEKYFVLANDITYSHTTEWDDENSTENNYTAIGGYFGNKQPVFRGTFDGHGHTVSGIRIYKDGNSEADCFQGLFGWAWGGSSVIRGITLADTRITGYGYVGGIVGMNDGTVSDCHVAANVVLNAVQEEAFSFGGIVGYNDGTVRYCTSAATLTKTGSINTYNFGGIVGDNAGTMSNNLAIGVIVPAISDNSYGAICGENGDILSHNYYYGCTVAGVENATGVGCGYIEVKHVYTTADITDNDGAVPGIILYDHSSRTDLNSYILTTVGNNAAVSRVALAGRTLYKDGDWNTLCLPFDVDDFDDTIFDDAKVMELDVDVDDDDDDDDDEQTGFNGETGTLSLYFKEADKIEAGKPYLVKWETTGDDIENPVFTGVTISSTTPGSVTSDDNLVQFKGIYNPAMIYSDANDNLFLGAENTLYWPSTEGYTLNAFRAYFHVNLSGDSYVREIRMNLDGDAVTSIQNSSTSEAAEPSAKFIIHNYPLPTKRIVNGRLIIERNNQLFNANGMRMSL